MMEIDELLYCDELHMAQLMKAKLCELGFAPNVLRILKANGITTLGDLCRRSRRELLSIRFLGEPNVAVIERLLATMDLGLRKD